MVNLEIILSKEYLVFRARTMQITAMHPLSLDKKDPVLNMISDKLQVSMDEILETLETFFKFFPNQPERSKREDIDECGCVCHIEVCQWCKHS